MVMGFSGDSLVADSTTYLVDLPENTADKVKQRLNDAAPVLEQFGVSLSRQFGVMKHMVSRVDEIPDSFEAMTKQVSNISTTFSAEISVPYNGIKDNITDIQSILAAISSNDVSVPTVPSLPSDADQQISNMKDTVSDSLNSLNDMGDTVNSTVSTLQKVASSEMDDLLQDTQTQLNKTADTLHSFVGTVDDIMGQITPYITQYSPYLTYRYLEWSISRNLTYYRSYVTYVLYSIIIFLFFLGLLGGVLQYAAKTFAKWMSCWYEVIYISLTFSVSDSGVVLCGGGLVLSLAFTLVLQLLSVTSVRHTVMIFWRNSTPLN